VFQEPMSSLNPLQRVHAHIAEALTLHGNMASRETVFGLLAEAGLSDLHRIAASYPHRLSGGQRQRVMIAMALANKPRFFIADEPTTALDVTLQSQILDLIARARAARGLGVLLVTHDLALVRRYADRVLVMDRGCVVEDGPVADIFAQPRHAQTQRLLAASELRLAPPARAAGAELLRVEHLTVRFAITRGLLRRQAGDVAAVDDVSFTLAAGETLGLVGESGSGKSTIALCLARLIKFHGRVMFDGADLGRLRGKALRAMRQHIQIVFQDPFGSLAPRMTVGGIIAEGLMVHEKGLSATARAARAMAALREVGLPADAAPRYPHEFSGGQRQRIAIARALILKPKLLILDEPTSALDITVQAEILRLLQSLQQRHGLAYLFISHDMRVIRAMAHRVMVLRDGRLIEQGTADEIFNIPREEYTKALIAATSS